MTGLTPQQARAQFVLRLARIMNPDQLEEDPVLPRRTAVAKTAPTAPRRRKRAN